jgi:MbtH protein
MIETADYEAVACKVVVNQRGQFSIWSAGRENLPGWVDSGKSGTREECLAYIRDVWRDIRPLVRH